MKPSVKFIWSHESIFDPKKSDKMVVHQAEQASNSRNPNYKRSQENPVVQMIMTSTIPGRLLQGMLRQRFLELFMKL